MRSMHTTLSEDHSLAGRGRYSVQQQQETGEGARMVEVKRERILKMLWNTTKPKRLFAWMVAAGGAGADATMMMKHLGWSSALFDPFRLLNLMILILTIFNACLATGFIRYTLIYGTLSFVHCSLIRLFIFARVTLIALKEWIQRG